MKTLYFYINGSGSPFWLKEQQNNIGGTYFLDLFWPENHSLELKNEWHKINVLFETYSNPINRNSPSLWRQSMCDIFNSMVEDFIALAKVELSEFNIINRYSKLKQDDRLVIYRQNILKSHTDNNKIIHDETEFENYFKYRNEIKSILASDVPFETNLKIQKSEYDSLNRITLRFGLYDNFQVSICAYSFKTFITNINIGGHFAVYELLRIHKEDILINPKKILALQKKVFYKKRLPNKT